MSILVDENTRLVGQGITGKGGSFHIERCMKYGTKVVAGVTPGKEGTELLGFPIYNTVARAVKEKGANTSIIFVPPPYAPDAIMEAADAGIALVVCITEGIPALDMVPVHNFLKGKNCRLIGPNCPGVLSTGKAKVGLISADVVSVGHVGVVSRSGTLTYEAVLQCTKLGIGQTTCVGIGGDPLPGTSFIDVLKMFQADKDTEAIIMIGEIGGSMEQDAAEFIKKNVTKPMVSFIAGVSAPPGKRMGHAGAIVSGASGRAQDKIDALKAAGVTIAPNPAEIGLTMKKVLENMKK
jgi:succinyl-CoA synthetase alpha subunit